MPLEQKIKLIIFSIIFLQNVDYHSLQETGLPPVCDSELYCQGELLKTVQLSGLYDDSKTFVDKKLKKDPSSVMRNFEVFMEKHNSKPSKTQVEKFVQENFDPEGSEFESWNPTDWKEIPEFAKKIGNKNLRYWALHLNSKWKKLGRNILKDVEINPQFYSQIYVEYPVIVPGGRFREYYYWDSYWTIRGLLICEMEETVKGMLENFKELIGKIGFIPNGGRIYYLRRSQPPLYIQMIKTYVEFTHKEDLLKDHIDSMEKEFDFWMKNRTIKVNKDGKEYTMAIYNTETVGPRPESYAEDVKEAAGINGEQEKIDFYNELKSAAESGWDFSSRWFSSKSGSTSGTLKLVDTNIRSIVPVDLNAILCGNAYILSEFNKKLGRNTNAKKFENIAKEWQKAVHEVLRDEESGVWFDFDWKNNIPRKNFYLSNFAPLWTNCYDLTKKNETAKKVLGYMKRLNLKEKNVGGVPSSLVESGEQWDYPNVWPPLQHILVTGLRQTGNQEAVEEAFFWVERFVQSVFLGFVKTGHMYEKYASNKKGVTGRGGEYCPQEGFGWTNAVILEFLSLYYSNETESKNSVSLLKPGKLSLMLPLLGLFMYNIRRK